MQFIINCIESRFNKMIVLGENVFSQEVIDRAINLMLYKLVGGALFYELNYAHFQFA